MRTHDRSVGRPDSYRQSRWCNVRHHRCHINTVTVPTMNAPQTPLAPDANPGLETVLVPYASGVPEHFQS